MSNAFDGKLHLFYLSYLETGLPRRGEELLQADGTAYVGARVSDRQILVNREMPVVKIGAVQDNAGQLGLHPGTGDSLVSSSHNGFLIFGFYSVFQSPSFKC